VTFPAGRDKPKSAKGLAAAVTLSLGPDDDDRRDFFILKTS